MTENYRALIASYEADEGYPDDGWIAQFRSLDRFALKIEDAAQFLVRDLPPIAKTISSLLVRIEDGKDEVIEDATVKRIEYHTGGWSGAEDLIGAMLGQFWIGHFHTRWERGGHFYFEVPDKIFEMYANGQSDDRT